MSQLANIWEQPQGAPFESCVLMYPNIHVSICNSKAVDVRANFWDLWKLNTGKSPHLVRVTSLRDIIWKNRREETHHKLYPPHTHLHVHTQTHMYCTFSTQNVGKKDKKRENTWNTEQYEILNKTVLFRLRCLNHWFPINSVLWLSLGVMV